ncbi:MAG TPA: NAD(P)-dependent oxidoreductase [Stellaceae bacterium]|jgi:precorrin-2 dehydrogenase/sirohydrochlorin ferrochelatase|nr:NAD(P)-dependent oxidoreductase [Stellaceae bacterium]
MLPISVDLSRLKVVLVGDGEAARRRLALLDEAGAADLELYAPHPPPALVAAAGGRLRRRLPEPAEIARARLVFLARVEEPAAGRIRQIAAAAGVLLNTEDEPAFSDFHSAAVVRRGDFTLAISTNGRSPGLAAAVRRKLEMLFGPEWQARLDRAASSRAALRAAGS